MAIYAGTVGAHHRVQRQKELDGGLFRASANYDGEDISILIEKRMQSPTFGEKWESTGRQLGMLLPYALLQEMNQLIAEVVEQHRQETHVEPDAAAEL
jgi:hypothetical protein